MINPYGDMTVLDLMTFHQQQLDNVENLLTPAEMEMDFGDLPAGKKEWTSVYYGRATAIMAEINRRK